MSANMYQWYEHLIWPDVWQLEHITNTHTIWLTLATGPNTIPNEIFIKADRKTQ